MNTAVKELQQIPGIGKKLATALYRLGYTSVSALKGENPELMYIQHNDLIGEVQDICVLYTFRCAVYFASTPAAKLNPQKMKWWYWMDKKKVDSKTKDAELRDKLVPGRR